MTHKKPLQPVEINKSYKNIRFSADILEDAVNVLYEIAKQNNIDMDEKVLKLQSDDSKWQYDSVQEFMDAYEMSDGGAIFDLSGYGVGLLVRVINANTSNVNTAIEVEAPSLSEAKLIYDVFERHSLALNNE